MTKWLLLVEEKYHVLYMVAGTFAVRIFHLRRRYCGEESI